MRPASGHGLQGLPARHLDHGHEVAVQGEDGLGVVLLGVSGHGGPRLVRVVGFEPTKDPCLRRMRMPVPPRPR